MPLSHKEIQKLDHEYIWHPLTQHKTASTPMLISSAKGNYLYDAEGRAYFDAISSWYTCSYGHAHPYLTHAVKQQIDRLHHVVFAGMTHEPAAVLSKKLIGILPANQSKIFFSENGSTSVEIAIKMAFQYHFNKGEKRQVVLAFEDGFHGDTFGAMSASDLSVYNGPFEDFFIEVKRIPVPNENNLDQVLAQLQHLIDHEHIASFIYEPLVQGAAAMKMHQAVYLDPLLSLLKSNGVICIADEVMTGFGKTGTLFASDQIEVKPDIMCLSKALTGGIMPMAVTSCAQHIYDAFYDDSVYKGFFHGHTYSGNPLGCTAASAAIDLLLSDEMQDQIKMITASHEIAVQELMQHQQFINVRSCGIILAVDLNIDMQRYGSQRDELFNRFMKKGIFLRPLGNTFYIVPPFTTTQNELQNLYNHLLKCTFIDD